MEKKVSGEIAFDLISLFHVQIQEPKSRSITRRAFVFLAKFAKLYYHKIFETRNRWPPKRAWMNVAPVVSMTKDLSMSRDQKVMM